jgi:biopolymer transport protein ExbD
MARKRKDSFAGQKARVDLSPMIDLVFLLLIFFMIASTAITYPKIAGITVPDATVGKTPDLTQSRVVINIFKDGRIVDADGLVELSLDDVEVMMAESKAANPKVQLHLRADKETHHKKVKEVIASSARGGVSSVIFSTLTK